MTYPGLRPGEHGPLPRGVRLVLPVPPVRHFWWSCEDWLRTAKFVEEPDEIRSSFGLWRWSGEFDQSERKIYRLEQ